MRKRQQMFDTHMQMAKAEHCPRPPLATEIQLTLPPEGPSPKFKDECEHNQRQKASTKEKKKANKKGKNKKQGKKTGKNKKKDKKKGKKKRSLGPPPRERWRGPEAGPWKMVPTKAPGPPVMRKK